MLNAYVILSVLFIFTKPKISTANFLVDFLVRKMHAEPLGFYAVMHALSYCTRSVTSQIKVAMTKVLMRELLRPGHFGPFQKKFSLFY